MASYGGQPCAQVRMEEQGLQSQFGGFDRLHEAVVGVIEVRVNDDLRAR